MSATNELIDGMAQGREWIAMGDSESVRTLLGRVYDERYHSAAHHKDRFQLRVNLQKKDDAASYAGWITAENPMSGPYQGTSFVWFPGMRGSVAVLVIGTDGFGADTAILGRPGHARRLRALSRLHRGKVWVKPDLLDVSTVVPNVVAEQWPDIEHIDLPDALPGLWRERGGLAGLVRLDVDAITPGMVVVCMAVIGSVAGARRFARAEPPAIAPRPAR